MNRLPDMDQRDQDGDWEPEEHDNLEFQCPCGDEHCRGYQDDAGLIILFGKHFASDCAMAKDHPEVVRGRELEAIYDRSRR